MQEKNDFFNNLEKLINDFNIKGIKEVKTIALVYQVAFKLIEKSGKLKFPIAYKYTEIDFNKNIAEKHIQEIQNCSLSLIDAVMAGEAYDDLMTEFIETKNLANTNLGQYFTPRDLALFQAEINISHHKLDDFSEDKYFWIGDDTGCGAGSLILAYMKSIKELIKGFEDIHYQSIAIRMNDIDVDLSKIAYFQVVLSSLLHSCPIGIVVVEGKNILTEYQEVKNRNEFVMNMPKYTKYKLKNQE
ncbi:N-6 DNA methylase [Diaphorobacter sp. HDW4A]|uniref:N-6 DNA methylase n=1 Tax=Diaphorobacter sp. HDW4A TaxID=2714924 RepID=UPI00140BB5D9|nr:N-6 DNA methylase [Diaphorobacter sp. HDW4A]QIL78569.1 N-6 DNA methylase [Diaphorobacter sp. HDW4A]